MPKPLRIVSVVGARPNFMKAAPIVKLLNAQPDRVEHLLLHTGQHYDERMSESFFADLGMPRPDVNLGVGSASHASQTAKVMIAAEPVFNDFKPDVVVVAGDVNSTLACALTAKKLGITVAHVEAGLRSFDMTMPEEVNRLCTDVIADLLFTTDRFANANLAREGIAPAKIHFVGNVMIDSLLGHLAAARRTGFRERLGLLPGGYATLTLHRPANVDTRDKLAEILDAVRDGLGALPAVFPVHPRTRRKLADFGLADRFAKNPGAPGIWLAEPLGYLDFLDLNSTARLVLTDSGGLQEEATILGVPCVTLRDNTERPVTITDGTNRLAGTGRQGILAAIADALSAKGPLRPPPEKWDGKAAERIVDILLRQEY